MLENTMDVIQTPSVVEHTIRKNTYNKLSMLSKNSLNIRPQPVVKDDKGMIAFDIAD